MELGGKITIKRNVNKQDGLMMYGIPNAATRRNTTLQNQRYSLSSSQTCHLAHKSDEMKKNLQSETSLKSSYATYTYFL